MGGEYASRVTVNKKAGTITILRRSGAKMAAAFSDPEFTSPDTDPW